MRHLPAETADLRNLMRQLPAETTNLSEFMRQPAANANLTHLMP
jgi:hypothetical protein